MPQARVLGLIAAVLAIGSRVSTGFTQDKAAQGLVVGQTVDQHKNPLTLRHSGRTPTQIRKKGTAR